MKYFLFLYFILLLNGCSDDSKVLYRHNNATGVYRSFYPKHKCQITISLDSNKSYISSISSNCTLKIGLSRTIEGIKDLLNFYNLQISLKKSKIIKITFYKNTTNFPYFIKYFNKLPSNYTKIFNYDKTQSLESISKEYLERLSILIKNSNLYGKELKKINTGNCNLFLDFSYWKVDKELQTVPKATSRYIIEMDGVIEKENIKFKDYPHIEYLPVKVVCQDKR